jgi:phospho-N-acetylmuramoyl-pentapeptide-transferase
MSDEIRLILAFVSAFVLVALTGVPVIRVLRRLKIGDTGEFDQATMNQIMSGKHGTPTMGGVMLIPAIALAGVVSAGLTTASLVCGLVVVLLGLLGSFDDRLKLRKAYLKLRGLPVDSTRQGISAGLKLAIQFAIAIGAVAVLVYDMRATPLFQAMWLPGMWMERPMGLLMSAGLVGIVGIVAIVGASNAVNITDGLDGLASTTVAISAVSLAGLGWVAGDRELADRFAIVFVPEAHAFACVALAVAGACTAFLIYNRHPARVFMGDTGSLALGGVLGLVAVGLRQEAVLVVLGGVFVIETLSVMLQVAYFKYTRRKHGQGKRLFRMAPLHHHYQQLGWHETRVVRVFVLTAGLLASAVLGWVLLLPLVRAS